MIDDNMVAMVEKRYHIYEPDRQTDWDEFEKAIWRTLRSGNPDVHIDLAHEYMYSVDDCQAHRYPLGIHQMRCIVYQDEPHMSCLYCGLILTMPGGHTWDRGL